MTVQRRTALRAAAWAAPIVVVTAAVPAAAASDAATAPRIDQVTPARIPAASATLVTVTGDRFLAFGTDVSVTITSVTYTPPVSVISTTELTFTMPATQETGRADLLITTTAGTAYGALTFY